MFRLLAFAGLGITAATILVAIFANEAVLRWGLYLGLGLALGCGLLSLLFQGMREARAQARWAAQNSAAAGQHLRARPAGAVPAQGRVEQWRESEIMLRGQPLRVLTLLVAPRHGEAFTAEVKASIPPGLEARFAPGTQHELWLHGTEPGRLDFTGRSGRQEQRAFLRPVLHDSPALNFGVVTINASGASHSPAGTRSPGTAAVMVLASWLAFFAGAAAVAWQYQDEVAYTVQEIASGQFPRDLRTSHAAQHLVQAVAQDNGHQAAYQVVVFKNFAVVTTAVQPGQQPADTWQYYKAAAVNQGPAAYQGREAADQFNLDEVNWQAIWPAMEKTAAQLGTDISDEDHFDVTRQGRQLQVSFDITGPYTSAHATMHADGTGLAVSTG